MLTHSLLFLLSCSVAPMPDLVIPESTLILRESFQGPGAERTGNWWGRFDEQGCWWEAHNTWLVVQDPLLVNVSAHHAHWNAVEPDEPWFCIQGTALEQLNTLVSNLPKGTSGHGYTRAFDRWSIIQDGRVNSHVVYRGKRGGEWRPLLDYFYELSSVSVWGQSPE